jgi:tRNA U34 2-thiouridine synthase MnmA/TrmU
MQLQGISVTALHFTSPFFGSGDEETGKYNAHRSAEVLGVPLLVHSLGTDYLEMLRNPNHGYGKAVNPCVDCHAWMFRVAKGLMPEYGADFIISGEVLGQRPMSQRRDTLRVVERVSGLKGLLLRPLSAHCLPPTIPEQEGWVDRERLLAITGRSRKTQMRLAEELGVRDYPSPAGGCLLTEVTFAAKIRDLFAHNRHLDPLDFRLLRIGRHFRLSPEAKLIVGRNEDNNQRLEMAVRPGIAYLRWLDGGSPLGVVVGEYDDELLGKAARILLRYTRAAVGEECRVKVDRNGGEQVMVIGNNFDEAEVEAMIII